MASTDYVRIKKCSEMLNVIGETMLNDSDFCDVTLVCADNQHLPVHRAVICTGSIFLRELLFDSQHQRTFLYLGNVQLQDLRPLMEFLYLGSCTVERSRLGIVEALAESLKMSGFTRNLEQSNKNNISEMTYEEMSKNPEIANRARQQDEKDVKPSLLQEPKSTVMVQKWQEETAEQQEEVKIQTMQEETLESVAVWVEGEAVESLHGHKLEQQSRIYCPEPNCIYSSVNLSNVKKHRAKKFCPMLEVKDKVCPACSAAPFTQKSLRRHYKRFVCPSQFSCNMCDLKFRKASLLNVHKNSDHK